jgi:hypothetical protein
MLGENLASVFLHGFMNSFIKYHETSHALYWYSATFRRPYMKA